MNALVSRLLDPGSWDWGSVPDYVVMVTAIVSALLVVRQLAGLGDDRRQAEATRTLQLDQFRSEAQTARANLLLRIDEQYESGSLFRSRARWVELRVRFRREYKALAAPVRPREDYVREATAGKLNDLWDMVQSHVSGAGDFTSDVRDYNLMMRLPSWIETVGMIAREGLIPVDDILKLYGSVIRTTMGAVSDHMAHRATDPSASTTVFANALWLHDRSTP